MLVILDPPGNVPIFLSVTRQLSAKERHRAATIAISTAFLVIAMFAVGGQTILDYLNVSVPALQGAGGLLLLLVALQLLYGKGGDDGYIEASPEQRTSIAMVPLGTPSAGRPWSDRGSDCVFWRSRYGRPMVDGVVGDGGSAVCVVACAPIQRSCDKSRAPSRSYFARACRRNDSCGNSSTNDR